VNFIRAIDIGNMTTTSEMGKHKGNNEAAVYYFRLYTKTSHSSEHKLQTLSTIANRSIEKDTFKKLQTVY